ncbi:hypothetical protein FNH22_06525 [Fulvivirga sp. M361]|uniref:hypothetical protein n=1 Tax=Fulvivirga sp. M361 TaxID=2594266 RepID=UPI00117ACC20|nr:hypothetical protein [Fulvivirga sp. M361]TRX60695.1 hypothetical protein FNH22_06525 [Fulvivirga sp. M361]
MKPRMKSYGKAKNEILHHLAKETTAVKVLAKNMGMKASLIEYLIGELSNYGLVYSTGHSENISASITPKGRVFIDNNGFPETLTAVCVEYVRSNIATILSIVAIAISALALYNGWSREKTKSRWSIMPPTPPPSESSFPDSLETDQYSP